MYCTVLTLMHFILFLDPPEAETVLNNAIKYRSVGDNVTMIAAATISGNPSYTTIWRNPMDQVIDNTIGGRFSFPVVGRLKITNINEDDFGTYRFVATNVIGDLEVMNMLIKHSEYKIIMPF